MIIKTTAQAYDAFDNYLDEFGNVDVIGFTYPASRVLLVVDPIAYRCAFHDWADSEGIDVDDLDGDLYRHH